jgi:hypothetical protein
MDDELFLAYKLTSPHEYGLTLIQRDVEQGDSVYEYTLEAQVKYKSDKIDIITRRVLICDDGELLIDVANGNLYEAIRTAYLATGNPDPDFNSYYKSELS